MTYLRTDKFDNGGVDAYLDFFECDECKDEVPSMDPRYQDTDKDEHYCWHCGFKVGKIPENEFLQHCGVALPNMHAAINPKGDIEIWTSKNKTPPWDRSDKEQRRTPRYKKWRIAVFERDSYSCQNCGQVGGELNAHHIKHFSTFKKLRYELSNGLTLCVECHKRVHKKKR